MVVCMFDDKLFNIREVSKLFAVFLKLVCRNWHCRIDNVRCYFILLKLLPNVLVDPKLLINVLDVLVGVLTFCLLPKR